MSTSNKVRTSYPPGSWQHGDEFKPGKYGLQDVISIMVAGEVVAHINCGFGRGEDNARLIAAVPELLAALRLARECIAYCRRAHIDAQSGDGLPVEVIIDAAIAKAGALK